MARRQSEKRKASSSSAPSADLDALYALPLAEFTPARNALARKLRDAGEEAAADEVETLPKPTPAAWAINQLSRRSPDDVRALLEVAERLRQAQRQALHGGGADSLREETRAQRGLLLLLADDAGRLLREVGKAPTRATLDQIQRTLTATANGSPEERMLLEKGRLTRPMDPTSFGGLVGVKPPSPEPRGRQGERDGRQRAAQERERVAGEEQRQREEHERTAKQAQEQERAAKQERERAAKQERERTAQARAELERQRREVQKLRRKLAGAEREAGRLEAAARKAEETAARARARAAEAGEQAEALRREVAAGSHLGEAPSRRA